MSLDEFEQYLRDALTHLYDPLYVPPTILRNVITLVDRPTPQQFQEAIIAAINLLKPASDTPPNARSRRLYELLAARYIQELTQEETAERLGITPRHLRREQQAAVQLLAKNLWATRAMRPTAATALPDNDTTAEIDEPTLVWRRQVQQELAALDQSDPNAVANVGVVLEDARRLIQRFAEDQRITIEVALPSASPLTVRVHPSLVRQMVIIAAQKLMTRMDAGMLTLAGRRTDAWIELEITGALVRDEIVIDSEFMRETVAAIEGEFEITRRGNQQNFLIRLPYLAPVTVLVVDDNRDLVHFYRRYTEHTRYSLVHTAQGRQVFDLVVDHNPAIIVLDVMLPDLDGWEVLTQLHENPTTHTLPVIICSVVRQEGLALALGATAYLAKPVRRQDFIQTLNRVLEQRLDRAAAAN